MRGFLSLALVLVLAGAASANGGVGASFFRLDVGDPGCAPAPAFIQHSVTTYAAPVVAQSFFVQRAFVPAFAASPFFGVNVGIGHHALFGNRFNFNVGIGHRGIGNNAAFRFRARGGFIR